MDWETYHRILLSNESISLIKLAGRNHQQSNRLIRNLLIIKNFTVFEEAEAYFYSTSAEIVIADITFKLNKDYDRLFAKVACRYQT